MKETELAKIKRKSVDATCFCSWASKEGRNRERIAANIGCKMIKMLTWSVALNKMDIETEEGYQNTRHIWTVNMDKMEKVSRIEHITNEEIVDRVEGSWTLMDKI